MSDLKLIALDAEDLAVVSAQLQDAVLRTGDLAFLPREKRFVAIVNRFDWLDAEAGGSTLGGLFRRKKETFNRRRAALRFDRVRSARHQDIDPAVKDRVLSLLAIQFVPTATDAPDGTITLTFSGGGAIALDVECIECELRDLGASWSTRTRPEHSDAAGEDSGDHSG